MTFERNLKINAIADRFIRILHVYDIDFHKDQKLQLLMDIDAADDDVGLRLDDLLNEPNHATFTDEVAAIRENIDQITGKFINGYKPKFAKNQNE